MNSQMRNDALKRRKRCTPAPLSGTLQRSLSSPPSPSEKPGTVLDSASPTP